MRLVDPLDEGTEQALDDLHVPRTVVVVDGGVEDLVLAVLRPGLGQALQLHVGGLRGQAQFPVLLLHGVGTIVIPDRLHLVQVQGQQPLPGDAQQLLPAHLQVHRHHPRLGLRHHLGHPHRESATPGELLPGEHLDVLDQVVGQQVVGDVGHVLACQFRTAEQVLDTGVHPLPVGEAAAQEHLHRLRGSAAHVVGHPRPVAHLHRPVEHRKQPFRQGLTDRHVLHHRVRQGLSGGRRDLLGGQRQVQGVHVEGAHLLHRQVQELADLPSRPLAAGVPQVPLHADFDTLRHIPSSVSCVETNQPALTPPIPPPAPAGPGAPPARSRHPTRRVRPAVAGRAQTPGAVRC